MSKAKKDSTTAIQSAVETDTSENIGTTAVTPNKKKERKRIPKKEINLVIDAGRSRIKFQAFADGQPVTPVIPLESLICRTDNTPFGELGAYTLSRSKGEDGKDCLEHWVVGNSAKFQQKDYIAMAEGDDHKITYFSILTCGAIASLPNLFDLSTGINPRNRSLTVRLTALSLASSVVLKESIEKCKWIKADGVKYRLSFARGAFLGLPEGYGASLYMQSTVEARNFLTFDIGFGTAAVTGYNNLGKLPKREHCSPNGGGGISTLIKEFSIQSSKSDSAKILRPSQLREILETSSFEEGKISAIAPDGRNIGNALELAIKSWIKDSPLTHAIEDLGTSGRKQPVCLCGGGFAIPPVRELVYRELVKVGIPEKNLHIPEQPGTVALTELQRLYTPGGNSETTD